MNKWKGARTRTQIANLAADGARLLDEPQLRLASGAQMRADGTCLPGVTYPASYTNPGQPDTVTDSNED